MENYSYLKEVLAESIKKNGEKPLTNKWLYNIINLAEKKIEEEENRIDNIGYHPDWD